MSQTLQSPRGMNDVLPPDSAKWQRLERACRDLFARYGYGEIRTPVAESTALFSRGVGEATDIVEKEMYTFADRRGRSLTLRPEMTASCARAYIEHAIDKREPVTRWLYIGPMFRYERMQTGRYRQFYQIGVECFGVAEPTIDAEQVAMLHALYTSLGVGPLEVCINSVGGAADRPRYRAALLSFLEPGRAGLCADCTRRVETNPLRVLDCKVPECKALTAGAPSILDHLGDEARAHFDGVQATLRALDVPFRVEPTIVRGLDYYTGTVFEILGGSDALGAQNTLVAGGRYDTLVANLGGPPTPGVGFALGVERTILSMPGDAATYEPKPAVYLATRGDAAHVQAVALAHRLRSAGVATELAHRRASMKAQFKAADKVGARYVVALGDDELASGTIKLRDMRTREEIPLALADLVAHLVSPPAAL